MATGSILPKASGTPSLGEVVRRAAATILVTFVSLVAAAPASASVVIDTTSAWDGTSFIFPFGTPETATYGQVVTAPAAAASLSHYSFFMAQYQHPATLTFRSLVYAWDSIHARAVGAPLWESSPRTVTATDSFQEQQFIPGGVPVEPGQRYVLLVSLSKDYVVDAPESQFRWGVTAEDGDAYPGGQFVYLNNGDDESMWTTEGWNIDLPADLAFRAVFEEHGPMSKSECKQGGWTRFGLYKNQGRCIAAVKAQTRLR